MSEPQNISVREIIPGNNDRTVFDQAALQELADGIREHGLIQPVVVRWLPDLELYQLVAGERRYRACKEILGWETIPTIVREDMSDEQAAAVMLCENVARKDLDPIDEARAYARRKAEFGWSDADCAEKAGVSTVRVKFRLKLLSLRPDLQDLVRSGDLQLGYAQILSDAHLDANRQLIALGRLRDNPSPTPTWFRRQVSCLLEEQAQDNLFDADLFIVQTVESKAEFVDPPHPLTTTPPQKGTTLIAILRSHRDFWLKAAEDWNLLGKPFKRQECHAAATAIALTLAAI